MSIEAIDLHATTSKTLSSLFSSSSLSLSLTWRSGDLRRQQQLERALEKPSTPSEEKYKKART